ncbi:DUF1285 domain-containing protein [Stappia sp. 28M-7]|uniref:DUF1285 domain-containing protein n=1 Tax=Stappia sp. 28M-7 TaxID=2762596 RepID=UPI00353041A6
MTRRQAEDTSTMPAGLADLVARAGKTRGTPPVEHWNPPFCGDIDMRIASDGRWYYMGSPIGREALVRLFASVLRRDEDGRHYLVTPVERVGITVEDAPFIAVEMHAQGEGRDRLLTLRTNVGDVVKADADHPLRFEREVGTDGLKPYIRVRGGLDALLARPLLYELAELFEEHNVDGRAMLGVWSGGVFFPAVAAGEANMETGGAG